MIRITAKTPGFRRGGIAHPATATEYADNRFTAKELKILQEDPELIVEILEGGNSAGPGNQSRMNAKDTVELVKTLDDPEELNKLATENSDRKSVTDAITKRLAELAAAAAAE